MELPDYLEKLKIEKHIPPTSDLEADLPFRHMNPRLFERFCCDLIESRTLLDGTKKIVEVLPIGEEGQKQGGADIFVKEMHGERTVFSLYEVKRVKRFGRNYFKRTIERFLASYHDWKFTPEKFFVFSAEELDQEKIVEYEEFAKTLGPQAIQFKIVPPSVINRWIKNSPEIVYKYFHSAWVEKLFGTRGLWHLTSFGYFNFEETAGWENFEQDREDIHGEMLNLQNNFVKIDAFLPTYERNSTSCLVTLRNGRYSHVMITLSHKELLTTYFCAIDAPISLNQRKFVIKSIHEENEHERYIVDIGNCRIFLSEAETEALCKAFDRFYHHYTQQVRKTETLWKSNKFNTLRGMGESIPLLRMKRGLWARILRFAQEHDTFNTEHDWSMFNACSSNQLYVWTNKQTEKLNRGFHAQITPKPDANGLFDLTRIDDEVILTLQIPSGHSINSYESEVNPREVWDAETTYFWIKNDLIPEVLRWDEETQKRTLLEKILYKKESQNKEYVSSDYCRSLYTELADTKFNDKVSYQELEKTIIKLQSHYSCSGRSLYFPKSSMQNLFGAVHLVLKQAFAPHFSYLNGNLGYLKASDMQDLLAKLEKYRDGECTEDTNEFLIDCALRCIQVSLRDNGCNLNNHECMKVLEMVRPFINEMQDTMLIERQLDRI